MEGRSEYQGVFGRIVSGGSRSGPPGKLSSPFLAPLYCGLSGKASQSAVPEISESPQYFEAIRPVTCIDLVDG